MKSVYDVLSESSGSNGQKEMTNISEADISNLSFLNRLKAEEQIYDPKSLENICCIELINNNKIYLPYESEWTIKDV
jgi:hypothetical protein